MALAARIRRTSAAAHDAFTFLKLWTTDARNIGALTPSGPALADLMTSEITQNSGPIIELGPGTGVLTHAILKRGIASSDITLIENNADFAKMLSIRFPASRVLCMDASKINRIEKLAGGMKHGAVISGLPLLSMPSRVIMGVMNSAFMALREGGAFYQFTYGPACPVPRIVLERLNLKATKIGYTVANIPPATVYRITRKT